MYIPKSPNPAMNCGTSVGWRSGVGASADRCGACDGSLVAEQGWFECESRRFQELLLVFSQILESSEYE